MIKNQSTFIQQTIVFNRITQRSLLLGNNMLLDALQFFIVFYFPPNLTCKPMLEPQAEPKHPGKKVHMQHYFFHGSINNVKIIP